MATLTIRQLGEKTKTRLRVRTAHHRHSMEEAREILRSALIVPSPAMGNRRRPFANDSQSLAISNLKCQDATLFSSIILAETYTAHRIIRDYQG